MYRYIILTMVCFVIGLLIAPKKTENVIVKPTPSNVDKILYGNGEQCFQFRARTVPCENVVERIPFV
jgi:hypothetical protein